MTFGCTSSLKRAISRGLFCLLMVSAVAPGALSQTLLDEPTSRGGIGAMRTVQIMDEAGFGRPIPAATLLIPEGWRTTGGVRWLPQAPCRHDATQLVFTAIDSKGLSAIELLPGTGWTRPAQGQGCPPHSIGSARQYLESLARHIRPNAAVEGYRDRPDTVLGTARSVQNNSGFQVERRTTAGQLLITYTQGGVRMQEILIATVDVQIVRADGIQGVSETMDGVAGPTLAMRAPYGRLDLPIAERVRQSFTYAPEWRQQMTQHNRQLDSGQAATVAERSRIAGQHGKEMGEIINDGWRRRQTDIDKGQRRTIDDIWGKERRKRKDDDD
jgi:hypothetical protein